MRVLFIAHNGQLYGANQVLLTLMKGLIGKGHDVSILLPTKKGLAEILKKEDVNHIVIPCFPQFMYIKLIPKYLIYPLLVILNIIVFPYIVYKINKFRPDIIYSNTSAENIGVWVAKILRIKHISHVHEFMSLDHKALFLGTKKCKENYLKKSDAVIFVSSPVMKYIFPFVSEQMNYPVIPNGLKIPNINIKDKCPTESLNFGVIGVFSPGKRQHMAIEYFNDIILSYYPQAKLHLIGDKKGSYKRNLLEMVERQDLKDNVIFHGFIQDTDEIYNEIDILLVFSEAEAFGLVTIEAMLRGVPVIGYDSAGTAELITNRETGYLFFDKKSFSTSLFELLSNDNYNNIRERALLYARSKFSKETYCNNIEKFLIKIINE